MSYFPDSTNKSIESDSVVPIAESLQTTFKNSTGKIDKKL
jgi:hypothetical protein